MSEKDNINVISIYMNIYILKIKFNSAMVGKFSN